MLFRTLALRLQTLGHAILFSVTLLMGSRDAQAAGVWTKLAKPNPVGSSGTMSLLTDGTVMVTGGGQTASFSRLNPDASGNYINGTWTTAASMAVQRLYTATNVLPSGKLFVLGGEYTSDGGLSRTGELYDPLTNKWTSITSFPQTNFGDDPSVLLPNGKLLCGYIFDQRTYLYDPANDSWTQTGDKLRGDRSDEETWVLLPDGSVLSYDVFASADDSTGLPGSAQRYNPTTGVWTDAGVVPVPLTGNAFGYELGPAALLPDGRVIQVGANDKIVFYNPATNQWTQGPTIPNGRGADDAPGCMLPNGHFIFSVDTPLFTAPTKLYDFDYTNNSLTDITPTGALGNEFNNVAYVSRMLMLPNGHMLLNTGTNLWDYAPTGSPDPTWLPTIKSVTKLNSTTYSLTGSRITGISTGASYGDDAEMDTNYPIISLKGPGTSSTVRYARTFNWTPGVSSAGSTALSTVQFTLPAGIPDGTYNLVVSANGIPSAAYSMTLPFSNSGPPNYVQAQLLGTVLTLTGDAQANTVNITQRLNTVTVTGGGSTLIGTAATHAQSKQFTVPTNYTIVCNFNQSAVPATNDDVSLVSVNSSSVSMSFGSGNDSASLTYCVITNLSGSGGPGTDIVKLVGTNITNNTYVP